MPIKIGSVGAHHCYESVYYRCDDSVAPNNIIVGQFGSWNIWHNPAKNEAVDQRKLQYWES